MVVVFGMVVVQGETVGKEAAIQEHGTHIQDDHKVVVVVMSVVMVPMRGRPGSETSHSVLLFKLKAIEGLIGQL